MTKRTKPVDESEEEIEEYEVESIASHRVIGKTAKRIEYNIKWKGYDSSENTWEPESSVHAEELVEKYWNKYGGIEARDALKSKPGKGGRKSNAKSTSTQAAAAANTRKAKTAGAENPTAGENSDNVPSKRRRLIEISSAAKKKEVEKKQLPVVKSEETSKDDDSEDEEEEVNQPVKEKSQQAVEKNQEEEEEDADDDDEVEDEIDPDDIVRDTDFRKDWDWKSDIEKVIEVQNVESEKKNSYRALIKWKDGKYSLHATEIIRSKCPQQLIDYYESKLVFEKK